MQTCAAYSVLTHEEIVDFAWKDTLLPLLKKRFPAATDDDLKKAHAFAYGGSVMQDMGYYPFGSKYFSDLTHYVRSGDFVVNLVKESSDLDEYAFALGALAHYSADNCGHPTVNQAVGLEFPKLRKKYGNIVTYEDNPKAHIRTEFGFDVTQVAKNRYTSDAYHDFIGFEISKPVLERAFQDTYGIPLTDVLSKEDLAIGTFRRAISNVIPEMTRVALSRAPPGDCFGNAKFQGAPVPLLFIARALSEGMGSYLSTPWLWNSAAGLLRTIHAQDRTVQGARFQNPHAENGRPLYRQRGQNRAGLYQASARNFSRRLAAYQYRF